MPRSSLEHLGRDLVEHVAVVGHQHQPAAVRGQPFLEELRSRRGRGGWSARRGSAPRTRRPAARPARRAWPGHPTARSVGASSSGAHAQAIEHRFALPLGRRPLPRERCPTGSTGYLRRGTRLARRGPGARRPPPARSSPANMRSSVLLPEPLRPDDAEPVAVADRHRDVGEQRAVRAGWRRVVRRR